MLLSVMKKIQQLKLKIKKKLKLMELRQMRNWKLS
jgi:hypothetical protein